MLPACLCFAPNSYLMLITLVARTWENLFNSCCIHLCDSSHGPQHNSWSGNATAYPQGTGYGHPHMYDITLPQSLLNSRVKFACGLCEWSVTIPALKETFKNYLVILRLPDIYRSRKHFPCSVRLMKQEWKFVLNSGNTRCRQVFAQAFRSSSFDSLAGDDRKSSRRNLTTELYFSQ